MSSYSLFRLFFRLEKPGKLGLLGNVGITYVTPILENQQLLLKPVNGRNLKFARNFIDPRGIINKPHAFRLYSTAVSTQDVSKSDALRESVGPKKKPKTAESPKVMLISETKAVSVVTLEEAQKIAERKTLHLVYDDSKEAKLKTEKPVYRLLTNAEFIRLEEETAENSSRDFKGDHKESERSKKKDTKTVMLSNKIAENDALSKSKQMIKWIEKGHQIRVMIGNAVDKGDAESVYKFIEEHMKPSGARFLQKVVKGGQIKFQLVPPKEVQPPKTKKAVENK